MINKTNKSKQKPEYSMVKYNGLIRSLGSSAKDEVAFLVVSRQVDLVNELYMAEKGGEEKIGD